MWKPTTLLRFRCPAVIDWFSACAASALPLRSSMPRYVRFIFLIDNGFPGRPVRRAASSSSRLRDAGCFARFSDHNSASPATKPMSAGSCQFMETLPVAFQRAKVCVAALGPVQPSGHGASDECCGFWWFARRRNAATMSRSSSVHPFVPAEA